MSGLGQNIHLLHYAFVVHDVEGSAADQVTVMHLQGYWFQSVEIEPRKVKHIKSGAKSLNSQWKDAALYLRQLKMKQVRSYLKRYL